jgi:hypothetical protein
MIEEIDLEFPNLIRDYENKWVAIVEVDGKETIVGSGDDASEATRQARSRGFLETILFKVPSFHVGYVP